MDLVQLGSSTAKAGFKNEEDVINIFNNWKNSRLAQDWLIAMNYSLKDIEFVKAEKIKGFFKADIQLQIKITIKLKSLIDCQNIQIKLVRNERGYNQVDKRWLKNMKSYGIFLTLYIKYYNILLEKFLLIKNIQKILEECT